MRDIYYTSQLLAFCAFVFPLLALADDKEVALPQMETQIGANFERGVAQDPDGRKYMLEFSDPQFFSYTVKLRKVWGRAKVVDGETLVIRGERISLSGIKAPDISETCKEKILNQQFDAGGYSLNSLKKWAAVDKAVVCYIEAKEGNPGTCFIWGFFGPINLARMQVRTGAAWASPLASSPYARDEGWAEGVASANRDPVEKNIWHSECKRPTE
ncbi:MAG: hypothetical protein RLO04_04725 [Limnobacter sp.]|jgi:endonuclease YncB( thermonuclease family)|uniref:thermonuclease family protein n=1 Tax=Limnobacter sp. TaxID=2003368 RepID=UPI0032EC2FE0